MAVPFGSLVIEPYRKGYKTNGEYCARVTTVTAVIAKPQLIPWAIREALKKVREELEKYGRSTILVTQEWIDELIVRATKEPDRLKEESADIGTRAHKAIDQIIRGQTPDMESDIIPSVEQFLSWKKSCGIDLDPGEIRVASVRHKVAGTLDSIGRKEGKLVILDWKTSNGVYVDYVYQVGGYCLLWEEMFGEKPEEAWIIRFPKEAGGTFEAKQINNIELAKEGFLHAKGLYDLNKREWFQ